MKIQQENICEYPKICEIREHFLSWIIPVIRYVDFEMHGKVQSVSGSIPENSVSWKWICSDKFEPFVLFCSSFRVTSTDTNMCCNIFAAVL